MTASRLFAVAAVALLFALPADAQNPKKQLKKQQAELAKKAEEEAAAKKAAEARKAEEESAKKAEEARKADEAKKAAVRKAAPAGKFDAAAVAKLIDQQVDAKLKEKGIAPSGLSTDAEFLRRVYLDITGVIPTAEKAKAFLDDKSPDKRAALIDALLDDPNYGRKRADIWLAKLFPKDSDNRFVQPGQFHDWLKDEFNANTPWDKFVRTIVTAEGEVDEHPEVTFFLANRTVDKLTDATTQHFLGVRLSCAQCHNHPFTATKQTEYWGMAAFYSKVNAERPKNPKKGADNSQLGVHEGTAPSKQKDFFPESTKKVTAKFLGGDEPKLIPKEPYRPQLADWMVAADNPYFARAMVNRTWAQLFGHGIVDPVDDLIEKNKPSHPELFDELAKRYAAGGFDTKALIRGICLSQSYQRSAKPSAGNKDDAQLFSHMAVKMATPEMLFDSLAVVLVNPTAAARKPDAKKKDDAPKKGPATDRDRFVQFFLAGAEEPVPTDYEAGIPQALRIMNSKNGPIVDTARQLTSGKQPAAALEAIYLTALARRPTADETTKLTAYLRQNPTDGYADVLWAVVNSSEFRMIR